MRIDKILANMGYGTRKEVKGYLKDGFVSVDGKIVKDSGQIVDVSKQTIIFDGETVVYKEFVYLMMNKPAGVLSATEDSRGAKTAIDILPTEYLHYNVGPVGRLDVDTEGFLLLTNDGTFVHDIISPNKHVDKVYYARVDGELDNDDVEAFEGELVLGDGYKCMPAKLEIISSGLESEALIILHEGKFHQVKRMFLARQKKVSFLKRISIGGVKLDEKLAIGETRELTESELEVLNNNGNE